MVLTCISLMITEAEHLFHAPVGRVYVFFRGVSSHRLCPFKKNQMAGFFGC